jgi:O-antigen ligase
MVLGLNWHKISFIAFNKLIFFSLFAGLIAASSVLANNVFFYWFFSPSYYNIYFFIIAFFSAICAGTFGLAIFIFLLPISSGICPQLNAYFSTQLLTLPNVGLDLAAGYYFGSASKLLISSRHKFVNKFDEMLTIGAIPKPVLLGIGLITLSVFTAILRNLHQTAAFTSFKGVVFNLMHFRPIDWRDAYMPISDWISYSLAFGVITVVIIELAKTQYKNQLIFRPIIFSLVLSAFMGIVQATTGFGLPDSLLTFRKDQLGFAAIGFQPDLHSFAGLMILGCIGLLGYLQLNLSKFEKSMVLFVILLCWIALVLSKSRASLLLALLIILILVVYHFIKSTKWTLIKHIFVLIIAVLGLFVLILNFAEQINQSIGLYWVSELFDQLKHRDLLNISDLSGIFGSRFEIWGAAWRMFWNFPLAGIGQGNFYHLSSISFFSKSHFLILNGGENAHNYFLQTTAELGIVGAFVFLWILIYPWKYGLNKKRLVPAYAAIFSICLSNIFSHSLLVRDNLILVAVILGLLYIQHNTLEDDSFPIKSKNKEKVKTKLIYTPLVIAVVFLFYITEIIQSFGKPPFTYGFYCFRKASLTSDNWTSGTFEIPISRASKGVDLTISLPYFRNGIQQTTLFLELRHVRRNQFGYNDTIDFVQKSLTIDQKENILVRIQFSDKEALNSSDNIELFGTLSNCYSPRNLGDSVDSRLLGVQIKSINAFR